MTTWLSEHGCPPKDCGHDDTHAVEIAKQIAVIPAVFPSVIPAVFPSVIPAVFWRESISEYTIVEVREVEHLHRTCATRQVMAVWIPAPWKAGTSRFTPEVRV